MRWRLILEEFGPELKYIKEENNVVANALSRHENSPNQEILNISELFVVETLKEFRNILLGHQITVYTDHKNLTYKIFNTERVNSGNSQGVS